MRADLHQRIERDRDSTHTRNFTSGALADLLAAAGLMRIRLEEEEFTLDFDEWFNRGTPAASKESVRARLLGGDKIRGFRPELLPDGAVRIDCVRALARGERCRGSSPDVLDHPVQTRRQTRSRESDGSVCRVSRPRRAGAAEPTVPVRARPLFSPSQIQEIRNDNVLVLMTTSSTAGAGSSRSCERMKRGRARRQASRS